MRAARFIVIVAIVSGACSTAPAPGPAKENAATAPVEILPATEQPVSKLAKTTTPFKDDLDAIVARGYVRILVAPSRAHFNTVDGHHKGRAVDAGVALAQRLSEEAKRDITPVFIETREDQLIPSLLAGKGDIAANVRLTFARDEQVAFAPPIKTDIREFVVTDTTPLVSLEDVGGRRIHVRKDSDHHASLTRLNEQLRSNSRRQAVIIVDDKTRTDEELLDSVNAGRIRATVVDDYVFDRWQSDMLKLASTNRDVAVSQDGSLSWVTRKDAPAFTAFVKDFFTKHKLTF